MANSPASPESVLPRRTPEAMGIRSERIVEFLEAAARDGLELHSLMILRHGSVVAEGWFAPYRRDDVHLLYSLSKSFTSTAVGFAVGEGLLSVDDSVLSFFPDLAPADPSENLKAMRVRHLLSMSTGHAEDNGAELRADPDGIWMRPFLARPVPYAPGTHFLYNSSASYALSAIVHRLTGQSLLDYLRPRLFEPLGIEKATWQTDPHGICNGGSGMCVTTETIAKFGQLYLRRGVWNGRRILDEAWIDQATRYQVSNEANSDPDWRQGYGFQFWRCRHDGYRGDGAFGQFCVVMPNADMVVAITSRVDWMQKLLDLVWEHLLLPLGSEPLPENPEADAKLRDLLGELRIQRPQGERRPDLENEVSGRWFHGPSGGPVEAFRLDFGDSQAVATFRDARGEHSLAIGLDSWAYGTTDFEDPQPRASAAAGGWHEEAFEAAVYYVEDPASTRLSFRLDYDGAEPAVWLQIRQRGRFDAKEWELRGVQEA